MGTQKHNPGYGEKIRGNPRTFAEKETVENSKRRTKNGDILRFNELPTNTSISDMSEMEYQSGVWRATNYDNLDESLITIYHDDSVIEYGQETGRPYSIKLGEKPMRAFFIAENRAVRLEEKSSSEMVKYKNRGLAFRAIINLLEKEPVANPRSLVNAKFTKSLVEVLMQKTR